MRLVQQNAVLAFLGEKPCWTADRPVSAAVRTTETTNRPRPDVLPLAARRTTRLHEGADCLSKGRTPKVRNRRDGLLASGTACGLLFHTDGNAPDFLGGALRIRSRRRDLFWLQLLGVVDILFAHSISFRCPLRRPLGRVNLRRWARGTLSARAADGNRRSIYVVT